MAAAVHAEEKGVLATLAAEVLRCGVCGEQQPERHVLPCLHPMCPACADKAATEGQVTCPTCQVVSPRDSLKKDETGQKIKEAVVREDAARTERRCQYCRQSVEDVVTALLCLHCVSVFCEKCREKHGGACGKEDLVELSKTADIVFCGDHLGEVGRFYCSQCRCCLCTRCTEEQAENHKDHMVISLPQKLRAYHTQLAIRTAELRTQLSAVQARREEKMAAWEKNKQEVQNDLTVHVDSLIQKLKDKLALLMQDVDGYALAVEDDRLVKELESLVESSEAALASRQHLLLALVDPAQAAFREQCLDDFRRKLVFKPNDEVLLGDLVVMGELTHRAGLPVQQKSFLRKEDA